MTRQKLFGGLPHEAVDLLTMPQLLMLAKDSGLVGVTSNGPRLGGVEIWQAPIAYVPHPRGLTAQDLSKIDNVNAIKSWQIHSIGGVPRITSKAFQEVWAVLYRRLAFTFGVNRCKMYLGEGNRYSIAFRVRLCGRCGIAQPQLAVRRCMYAFPKFIFEEWEIPEAWHFSLDIRSTRFKKLEDIPLPKNIFGRD